VVILQGAPPSFCAGVDLSELSTVATAQPVVPPSVSARFAAFSKPIFASVNGAAAGGGLEIALACDFIIASETAKFLLPEVRIGSLPGGGGTQRLVRAIPRAVAVRMLYTGDAMDAPSALAYGLVTEIVDSENLDAHALALATKIAANAPLSLAAVKECLRSPTTHRSVRVWMSSAISGFNSCRPPTERRAVQLFVTVVRQSFEEVMENS